MAFMDFTRTALKNLFSKPATRQYPQVPREYPARSRGHVEIDMDACILCGLCVQACDSLGTGAISTVDRGTEKRVDTPYSDPSLDCIGCLSCANVCPTDAISYTQTDTERTIWNRTFRLVRCPSCGRMMGTEEAVAAAAGRAHVETPQLCDECRKKAIADSMARTYRYV